MSNEVWVLGGTGRSGREIARMLGAQDAALTLVGRDAARLEAAAPRGARALVAGSPIAMAEAIRRERPAVVVNTVGPFQRTATVIADAALESGHYVDLANDVATVPALLARDEDARRRGRTLVTGAGFGVTATESMVVRLMEGRGPASRVHVDMIPSMELAAGTLGQALAESFVEGLPGVPGGGRYQGRRIADGRLSAARIGGHPQRLTTPDGDRVTTALMPFGELIAAEHASGAGFVEAASSEAPSGTLARVMPAALWMLHIGPLRRFAARRLAAITLTGRPKPREHSWAHAHVEWADGSRREGWLRLPDAGTVTAGVATEVTRRLLVGEGRPGAYTPAALFGSSLAEACGGEYILAQAV